MARVQYGADANGNPIELQMVVVNRLDMELDKDLSKTDYLVTRITLDFNFQWHPWATASNTANAAAPPFDDIGMSVQTLEQILSFPRQVFRFAVGNTLVWEAPGVAAGNGLRLPCDPGLGPVTKVISLAKIEGEYGALGRMTITFWVYGGSNILLSNRWTVTADVNSCGNARRVIEGWATMRPDAIRPFGGITNVDDFRKWFLCGTPLGFRRDRVRVKIDVVGCVCNYTAVDVQDMNPLGVTGAGVGAVKFEGEVTAGCRSVFKDYHSIISQGIAQFGMDALGAFRNSVGLHFGASAEKLSDASWMGLMPTSIANGWCKVWCGQQLPAGPKGGPSNRPLLSLALAILMDRVPDSTIVSVMGTQRASKISVFFSPFRIYGVSFSRRGAGGVTGGGSWQCGSRPHCWRGCVRSPCSGGGSGRTSRTSAPRSSAWAGGRSPWPPPGGVWS